MEAFSSGLGESFSKDKMDFINACKNCDPEIDEAKFAKMI